MRPIPRSPCLYNVRDAWIHFIVFVVQHITMNRISTPLRRKPV